MNQVTIVAALFVAVGCAPIDRTRDGFEPDAFGPDDVPLGPPSDDWEGLRAGTAQEDTGAGESPEEPDDVDEPSDIEDPGPVESGRLFVAVLHQSALELAVGETLRLYVLSDADAPVFGDWGFGGLVCDSSDLTEEWSDRDWVEDVDPDDFGLTDTYDDVADNFDVAVGRVDVLEVVVPPGATSGTKLLMDGAGTPFGALPFLVQIK